MHHIPTTKDGHGKIASYLSLDYSGNKIHEKIINNLCDCLNQYEGDTLKATGLDLFNTTYFSRNRFTLLLANLLHPIEKIKNNILFDRDTHQLTKEGLAYINDIINEAITFYTQYLLRDIGNNFIESKHKKHDKVHFCSTEEVWNFFSYPSQEKSNNSLAKKQIYCSLIKIAYVIHDIKLHEKELQAAERNFLNIKKQYFFSHFLDYQGKEASETLDYNPTSSPYMILQTKCEKSLKRSILFSSTGRVKKREQIIVKKISDPKYNSLKAIHDIYGIRNEVKTKEDALFLLEYLRIHVFNKTGEISHKNIFGSTLEESQDFVKSYAHQLEPDFYYTLYKSLTADVTPGKNNKHYQDVKIRGNLGGYNSEIQITLVNNQNETGYAHHAIFDCKKKMRAISRLQGYISEILIRRYIREAIEKDIYQAKKYQRQQSELLGLGGYYGPLDKITEDDKKRAENAIFTYLVEKEKELLRLEIPGESKKYPIYISRSVRNHFHTGATYTSLLPKGVVVKYNNQRIHKKISL